jgi:DNA polymerase-4
MNEPRASNPPEPVASILHVDLDAFYASVEQLLDPTLVGKPVIVGGIGRRGVVCAASYEARRFGVHSAMPSGRAHQLCPAGIFLAPRLGVYTDYSKLVMAVLRDTTPLVEQLSVDEAFLDVSGARRLLGDGREIAAHVRARVRAEVGLTVSVGVATTKFLAKVASDRAKPDGLLVIEPGSELEFLHPLPVRALWGVGPKTAQKLERFGVVSVGDVARIPCETLVAALGDAVGHHLHDLAHNRDPRPVITDREAKSIGHEETFGEDLRARDDIERELLRLSDSVASRLRAAGMRARTVTVKARYPDFSTITRAQTLPRATSTSNVITRAARVLLDQIDCARGLRLVGVHCSSLVPDGEPVQGTLRFDLDVDDEPSRRAALDERHADIERTVDDVRRRFGKNAVGAAALLRGGERPNPAMPTPWSEEDR